MFFGIIFPKDRILQYFCLCEFNSVNFLHVNKTIYRGASGSKDGVALLLTIIWGTFAIHTNSSINYLVTQQDCRKKMLYMLFNTKLAHICMVVHFLQALFNAILAHICMIVHFLQGKALSFHDLILLLPFQKARSSTLMWD